MKEYPRLMTKLERYDRPIEIKRYHVIGIPLDMIIPFTWGSITFIFSKIKPLKKTLWRIDRNVLDKRRQVRFRF